MYTLKCALHDIYKKRLFKQKAVIEFFEDKVDNTDDFMDYMMNKDINYFYSHWDTLSARRYKQYFMKIFKSLVREHIKDAYFDFIKVIQPQTVANLMVDTQPIQADLGKIFLLKPQYIREHNV